MPMAAPVFPGLSQMFTNEFKFKPGIMERYLQEYNYVESTATFVAMSLGRPKSVGTLKLGSRDPFVPPLIQPNYFSHPDDVRAMVEGNAIPISQIIFQSDIFLQLLYMKEMFSIKRCMR